MPANVGFNQALKAYDIANTQDKSAPSGGGTGGGPSFADALGSAARQALEAGHKADAAAAQGVAGRANLQDVVMAVNNADMTLQTVVAVRDRVVQAYQQILQMRM